MSSNSEGRSRRERRGHRPARAIRLVLAYDGKAFGGSQRQPGLRTVQGEVERAVEAVMGVSVPVYLAGRTDQGVHAAGQVASLGDYRPDLTNRVLMKALNAHLPDDVAVLKVDRQPLGFHARHDARWREYRYRVWVGPKHPLAGPYAWQREARLSVDAMNAAAERLVGTQDVAAFVGGGEGVPWSERKQTARGTIRTIFICSVATVDPWWGRREDGVMIEVRIAADGFLPRMVRGIVGALVDIGRGAQPIEWIDALIAGRDRRLGPMNAPAHGLTLWQVGYAGDVLEGAERQPADNGGLNEGE